MHQQNRTWAEISLKNIEHNFHAIENYVENDAIVLGVVKANAYGHGSLKVAQLLQEIGCKYMAVATLDEAKTLRDGGITTPILILGRTSPEFTKDIIEYTLTQSVTNTADALEMSNIASALGKTVKVHLKLDTGMGRIGFVCHDSMLPMGDLVKTVTLPNLDFEGVFTHFAVSEVTDDSYTAKQFKSFTAIVRQLEAESGKNFKIKHCANSAAMLNYKEMHLDMVRPGIALYGVYPAEGNWEIDLRPAMELKTNICHIKDIEEGFSVSDGRKFIAPNRRKIATIPIGYADGLHRLFSGKIEVLIRGKRAKQVGNICMDMCMVDVTDIPDVRVGDTVTIFGCDGDDFISADEFASKGGFISYEALCSPSERVPRVHIEK